MERARSSDTFAERLLRSHLYRMGLRYRKNVKTVFGRPDVAFRGPRVAVFVDGDYWHGRILQGSGLQALNESFKTSNRAFWVAQDPTERRSRFSGEQRAGASGVVGCPGLGDGREAQPGSCRSASFRSRKLPQIGSGRRA